MSNSTTNSLEPTPPVAKRKPKQLHLHGESRDDEYFWLRERDSEEVLDYLRAENAYLDAQMASTTDLQATLYDEIRGRIQEDESSAPYRDGDYWYYVRFDIGSEYPIYARRYKALTAPEEIILDVNELAHGQEFMSVSGVRVSPDHKMLAYAVDPVGRRRYSLHFKDLSSGEVLEDSIEDVSPNPQWAADNRTIFYPQKDEQTLRSFRIMRHQLGESIDALVFEERDETFNLSLGKTKSRDFITIVSGSTVSTEVRLIDANDPQREPRLFNERARDHEYYVDHDGQQFYICTNLEAKNFRLMKVGSDDTTQSRWQEVVAHRADVLLEDFELFEDFLVLDEKDSGLTRVQVIERASGEAYSIDFGEPAYAAELITNVDYHTSILRFSYESMSTPDSVFDFDLHTREKTLVKQAKVLGGFAREDYRVKRIFAPAKDNVNVPVSIVYHKDTPLDGSAPLLQYAYGSYGYSIDATFSYSRLSLLDRGFVYAIAHVRGGSDMGRHWYDDGKLENKENTFTDFIEVTNYLIAKNYTSADRAYAMGGSAGGLLMGVIANQAPELYNGLVAAVPFVDIVTTMLDESIPLTTGEYDEWGNPNEADAYAYMLSYSPYDNVSAQQYTNMLVTTGLHDSQVQYWEPAKWVARLRALKTDQNLLLLHTNMEAGHGGASGRFEAIVETARDYAFLILLEDKRQQ